MGSRASTACACWSRQAADGDHRSRPQRRGHRASSATSGASDGYHVGAAPAARLARPALRLDQPSSTTTSREFGRLGLLARPRAGRRPGGRQRRLYGELDASTRRLRSVNEASLDLSSTLSLQTVLYATAERLCAWSARSPAVTSTRSRQATWSAWPASRTAQCRRPGSVTGSRSANGAPTRAPWRRGRPSSSTAPTTRSAAPPRKPRSRGPTSRAS